ncbi:hypothetical protein QYE76_052768 [Lolium multiflorum]|uniref:CCHC-type domain-containing protein n=1 Tax=Lolium multiflorum TaxID=4521 RepID=A0AAD8SV82_LOLMU|nr:hypothetical protein QYE76_052768 [Lolium multiflorum]
MLKCPIHELPRNVIINNFYARLSGHHKDYLDACLEGSFTSKEVEARWDLLDRIEENAEDWENDKGRESGYVEKPPFKPLPPKERNEENEKKKKKKKKKGMKKKKKGNKKKEVTTYPRVYEITIGNRKYVAPDDYYDNESEYNDLPMPFTYISDHDLKEHTTFDIENLWETNSENDDVNNCHSISTIHASSHNDIESSKLGDEVFENPFATDHYMFDTSPSSNNDGLLERTIFDLYLPEFDKSWVIHLRETSVVLQTSALGAQKRVEDQTVPQSGSTSVLGHTFGVDEDDVLLPVPAGSGSSRSSSESRQHGDVVAVVVENSGRLRLCAAGVVVEEEVARVWGEARVWGAGLRGAANLWSWIMASPSINFNQFLEKEKLKSNGSNFTDWFRHVRIFLNGGNLQYVLEAPLGPPPPPAVCEEEKNVFETRTKVYSQVQCAILCSLEAELQKRFEHHDPCEMIRELKVIFETHAAVESYEASKQFFGCMMEEGSSVSEHVFAMSGHARKLSDLGIVIPNQLGIHRVLQSLPPSYKNFVMNYNMQNMNKELPELFSMLKSAEVEIQKEHQVLMVNKTTKFKKQGKPKKDLKKGGKKAAAHPEKPKGGPKPDTDCYYCNGKGHWKRNCSKYLADLKSGLVKKKKDFFKFRELDADDSDDAIDRGVDDSDDIPEEPMIEMMALRRR